MLVLPCQDGNLGVRDVCAPDASRRGEALMMPLRAAKPPLERPTAPREGLHGSMSRRWGWAAERAGRSSAIGGVDVKIRGEVV